MKATLAVSILLCIIAYTAHAEPTQNSTETDIAVIKNEIKNLKESMETGFANVEKKFDGIEKKFDDKFDNIEKNFDRLNNIIIACIGIPMVILTIGATLWGILTHRRGRREDILQKRIETLTQEIEMLTQEIEILKQKRIVS